MSIGTMAAPSDPKQRWSRYGSADVAGILGLEDAYHSPFSTYFAKRERWESEVSDAMRWGSWLEPLILQDYSLKEDAGQIIATQAHHEFPDWELASATLDAVAMLGDQPIGVEAKSTRDFRWKEIPAPVLGQVQWQMGCSGLSMAHVAVLYKPRTVTEIFTVEFDKHLFLQVVDIVRNFHEKHVVPGIPPEADGHDMTTWALKRIEATDEVIEIDHLANDLLQLGQTKQMIKQLEEIEKTLANKIRAAMGSASVGTIGGVAAATWKPRTSTRFDSGRFCQDHADLAAKYKKTSTYRTFNIKKAFLPTGADEE